MELTPEDLIRPQTSPTLLNRKQQTGELLLLVLLALLGGQLFSSLGAQGWWASGWSLIAASLLWAGAVERLPHRRRAARDNLAFARFLRASEHAETLQSRAHRERVEQVSQLSWLSERLYLGEVSEEMLPGDLAGSLSELSLWLRQQNYPDLAERASELAQLAGQNRWAAE